MKKHAAMVVCLGLALASNAGAAERTPTKAGASSLATVAADAPPGKSTLDARKGHVTPSSAGAATMDPYATPLLLNAKPLLGSRS
jgi:hypothetical protein